MKYLREKKVIIVDKFVDFVGGVIFYKIYNVLFYEIIMHIIVVLTRTA